MSRFSRAVLDPAVATERRPSGRAAAHIFEEGSTTVVCLHGEFDLGTVLTLETALHGATSRDESDVVVDVGSVRFMDTTGLKLLLEARDRMALDGRSLFLRSARRSVRRLLEVADAEDLLAS